MNAEGVPNEPTVMAGALGAMGAVGAGAGAGTGAAGAACTEGAAGTVAAVGVAGSAIDSTAMVFSSAWATADGAAVILERVGDAFGVGGGAGADA